MRKLKNFIFNFILFESEWDCQMYLMREFQYVSVLQYIKMNNVHVAQHHFKFHALYWNHEFKAVFILFHWATID